MKEKKGSTASGCGESYYPVPDDETRATFALATSPIMSPEGTPNGQVDRGTDRGSTVGATAARRQQRLDSEERREQILRISTVVAVDSPSDDSPNAPLNGPAPPPPSNTTVVRSRRKSVVARVLGRKRAKHYIPILLLIVYSATGGGIFWALEGRGRSEAAARERARRESTAELERNRTIDLLTDLVRSTYLDHAADRLSKFDFSRLDRSVRNVTVVPVGRNWTADDFERLVNFTTTNSSMDEFAGRFRPAVNSNRSSSGHLWLIFSDDPDPPPIQATVLSTVPDLTQITNLLIEVLNDSTFALDDPSPSLLSLVDSILFNLTRSTPVPFTDDDEESTERRDWSYWTSVFYAGTIYTTVGYGYITANTDLGRAVTMAYALFGIPLVLYTLNQLGRILVEVIWTCYCGALRLRNLCLPVRYRIRRTKKVVAEFPFSLAVILTVVWMMLCSGLFCSLEGWPFFTSFYFFFQSLTTIGFGDVKPHHHEYLVGSFFLILIGLAMVSMCWSLLQLKFDHLINSVTYKITQKFVNAELEGGRMTTDSPLIENEVDRIAAGENAWLAAFLDENRRRVLMDEWRHRAKMSNKSIQTEVIRADRGVQHVVDNRHSSSQTPRYMSPEHQYRATEVPYRESTRRYRDTTPPASKGGGTMGDTRMANDDFRAMLYGLRNIIGECRETISNKDLTSVGSSPIHKQPSSSSVVAAGGAARVVGSPTKKVPKMSRASTTASITMLDI